VRQVFSEGRTACSGIRTKAGQTAVLMIIARSSTHYILRATAGKHHALVLTRNSNQLSTTAMASTSSSSSSSSSSCSSSLAACLLVRLLARAIAQDVLPESSRFGPGATCSTGSDHDHPASDTSFKTHFTTTSCLRPRSQDPPGIYLECGGGRGGEAISIPQHTGTHGSGGGGGKVW